MSASGACMVLKKPKIFGLLLATLFMLGCEKTPEVVQQVIKKYNISVQIFLYHQAMDENESLICLERTVFEIPTMSKVHESSKQGACPRNGLMIEFDSWDKIEEAFIELKAQILQE